MASDTYTTTLEVQAWQYTGDGVIPEGAPDAGYWHRVYPYHMHEVMRGIVQDAGGYTPPDEGTPIDSLFWDDRSLGRQECKAGGWIVASEYGVEAISAEWLAAAYQPVETTE